MTRVRALSNHPYGGRMRTKGEEYEAADEDVELLFTLRRVVPVLIQGDERTYATRELQASAPVSSSTRTRRRATSPNERLGFEVSPPSADEK